MSSEIRLNCSIGHSKFTAQALENQARKIIDDRAHSLREVRSLETHWNDPTSVKAVFGGGGNLKEISKFGVKDSEKEGMEEIFKKYRIAYYGECADGMFACSGFKDCARDNPKKNQEITLGPTQKLGLNWVPIVAIGPMDPVSKKPTVKDFRISSCINNANESIPCANIFSAAYLDADKVKGAEILSRHQPEIDGIIESQEFPDNFGEIPLKSITTIPLESITTESFYYEIKTVDDLVRKVICTRFHPGIGSQAVRSDRFKETFSASDADQESLAKQLEPSDAQRIKWQRELFLKLGISCKPLDAILTS